MKTDKAPGSVSQRRQRGRARIAEPNNSPHSACGQRLAEPIESMRRTGDKAGWRCSLYGVKDQFSLCLPEIIPENRL